MAPSSQQIFSRRITVLAVFLLLLLGAVVVRLVFLQIAQGAKNRKLAENQYNIYKKLMPSRGDIELIDPSSLQPTLLATNIKQFLVYAVPKEITEPQLTADSLATVLGMDPKDILVKVTDMSRKYNPIKKKLTDEEQAKITELKLPGIYFDSEDTRIYPQQKLLSQVLGFVGYKGDSPVKVGLYGLEKYFEKDLAGTSGSITQQNDPSGAWMFGSGQNIDAAEDGKNLILTIDKSIQFEAETVLKETVEKHGADSGSVIVENPKTGAILAMANYPDFDPNQFNTVEDPRVYNNEAVIGNYEPGSTFKAITMAAALNEGKITPDSTYTDAGFIKVNNYTIKNAEAGARGVQTMTEALDLSLNTGAIYAENLLGNTDFLNYLHTFSFGRKTGIELTESAGDLSNLLKGNIAVNYYTASFGQGITVTPIQMVQAYAALANGGKMMKPYIVQTIIDPSGESHNTVVQNMGQMVTPKTASTISAMLVDVVENGFGKKAAVPGYYVAGKTGTAQVVGANGKYDPTNNIGSFIGYGPVESPQFVILVRVDHPRDVQFAESTAGPAWGQIAKFILDYYHISPTRK